MCGVFAEFERTKIQERVQAGLKRARVATLSRNFEALAAVDFLNDCLPNALY